MRTSRFLRIGVAVLGKNTPVVGALATHLKSNPILRSLHVESQDLVQDIAQIPTHCIVEAVNPEHPFQSRDLVVVCPSESQDLDESLVYLAKSAKRSTYVLVLAEDVDYMTTRACHVLKEAFGAADYDPKRILGIPTLSVFRCRMLLSLAVRKNPFDIDVNVAIGGNPNTSVPLLAPFGHHFHTPSTVMESLTQDSRVAPKSSVNALAYAGSEFTFSFLKGLRGDPAVSECVFMEQSETIEEEPGTPEITLSHLVRRVAITKQGVSQMLPLGRLSEYEVERIKEAIPLVQASIDKAKSTPLTAGKSE